jgi:transcriptional regulator with XRE-family HTH domain
VKRKPIRSISSKRFKKLIRKLGLSQRGTARFLGKGERSIRRYASGEDPVKPAVAMLLELMIKLERTPKQVLRLIGINPRKAARETKKRLGPCAAPRYYDDPRFRDDAPNRVKKYRRLAS